MPNADPVFVEQRCWPSPSGTRDSGPGASRRSCAGPSGADSPLVQRGLAGAVPPSLNIRAKRLAVVAGYSAPPSLSGHRPAPIAISTQNTRARWSRWTASMRGASRASNEIISRGVDNPAVLPSQGSATAGPRRLRRRCRPRTMSTAIRNSTQAAIRTPRNGHENSPADGHGIPRHVSWREAHPLARRGVDQTH